MKPEQHKEAMGRLRALLGSMDLPDHRKHPQNRECLRWLGRCLHTRNESHADFEEAAGLLESLGASVHRSGTR